MDTKEGGNGKLRCAVRQSTDHLCPSFLFFISSAWPGSTAESLGDLDRAIASYESALRHNAYSIQALSQIATICRAKEDFKKAAEYFGRVVGIAPENGDVWGALG